MTRGDTIDKAIELSGTELIAQARANLAALPPPLAGEDDVVRKLRETLRDSLDLLGQIACGNVPRNAQSVLKAIELQLRYSQSLPKQTIEHQGAVGIAVIDPFAAPIVGSVAPVPGAAQPALPPAPAAKGPVIRRAAAAVVDIKPEP